MAYFKKIGVFLGPLETPSATAGPAPLSGERSTRLYGAFARDLLARLDRIKKCAGTIFYRGDRPEMLEPHIPRRFKLAPLGGETPGERLSRAFGALLRDERECAVIIGTGSPDVPLQYIKRAFLKLKHKDAVLGPTSAGGLYLAGLKYPPPDLFAGPPGDDGTLYTGALEIIGRENLALALLPLWYAVHDEDQLSLLQIMMRARRLEKSGRLMHTESALEHLSGAEE